MNTLLAALVVSWTFTYSPGLTDKGQPLTWGPFPTVEACTQEYFKVLKEVREKVWAPRAYDGGARLDPCEPTVRKP